MNTWQSAGQPKATSQGCPALPIRQLCLRESNERPIKEHVWAHDGELPIIARSLSQSSCCPFILGEFVSGQAISARYRKPQAPSRISAMWPGFRFPAAVTLATVWFCFRRAIREMPKAQAPPIPQGLLAFKSPTEPPDPKAPNASNHKQPARTLNPAQEILQV